MTRDERLEHIREWVATRGDWPSWVAADVRWLLEEIDRLETKVMVLAANIVETSPTKGRP